MNAVNYVTTQYVPLYFPLRIESNCNCILHRLWICLHSTRCFLLLFFIYFRSIASEAPWDQWSALPTTIPEASLSKARAGQALARPLARPPVQALVQALDLPPVLGLLGLGHETLTAAAVAPTPAPHPRKTWAILGTKCRGVGSIPAMGYYIREIFARSFALRLH